MKRTNLGKIAIVAAAFLILVGGAALAAPPAGVGGGGPPDGVGEDETASNHLSYPVIWSDQVPLFGVVPYEQWKWDTVTDPQTECFMGSTGGAPLDPSWTCYYDGSQVWWLQQRPANLWQAFNVDATDPVDITEIDWGDLLESSPTLNVRKIRTEVTLLQNAADDAQFSAYITEDFSQYIADTFQAFNMSGAVPGTDQSINETQGTDFGTGTYATEAMKDPTTVVGKEGYHATVYSNCARLIIQQIGDPADAVWGPDGYWIGTGVSTPVVDISAKSGSYSPEINAGGSLIYGYNWNAKVDGFGAGTYRLTFVIDGTDVCAESNTYFADGYTFVEDGEQRSAVIIPYEDDRLYGEHGLTYIDVPLTTSSGAGGGGGGGGNGPPSTRGNSGR